MFSKPSTLKSHNLKDLVDRVLFSLAPEMQERKAKFFFDHDLEENLEVFVDPQMLEAQLIDIAKRVIEGASEGVIRFRIQVLEIFDGKARFYFEIKEISKPTSIENLALDLEFSPVADGTIEKRYPRIFLELPIIVLAEQVMNQLKLRKILGRHQLKNQIVSDLNSLVDALSKGQFSALLVSSSEFELVKQQVQTLGAVKMPILEVDIALDPEYLAQKLRSEVQPLLNTQMIQKLSGYKMEGKSLLRVLADDYFQAAPNLFLQLAEALQTRHAEKTQYYAHRLKSSSMILGLVGIGSYCERLELLENFDQGSQSISEIKEIFEKSRLLLLNYLDNCSPQS